MSMKKYAASILAAAMLVGCTQSTPAASDDEGQSAEAFESTLYPTPEGVTYTASATNAAAPDWSKYDELVDEIRTTLDMDERVKLLHQAEDILMGTAAVIPLYYYNDTFMQKTDVDGIYSNVFGNKFFMFATSPRSVLKVNLASEPDKIDPALNTSVDGACLDVNLFSGLYTYDKDGNLAPDSLDHDHPYDVSEDGLKYTFYLQKDLKWSDGDPLTMNDFAYAWNRAVNPDTAADYEYMYAPIAGYEDGELKIEVVDDYTMTVELSAPTAYFLDLMAFPAFFPVKQSEVEGAEGYAENPGAWATEAGFVSNGAYTLESWKHNESMVFKKNPNYYRADEVTIEEINFMLSADDTAIFAAFQAGDLDFADSVPTNEIASVKDKPEFHVIDNLGTYYACFNVNSPVFEGKTVDQAIAMRKAFSLLIDRQYIVDTVGQTGQIPADSYLPAGMADGNGGVFKTASGWNYPNGAEGYYDVEVSEAAVEEARKLLEFAGYTFDDSGKLSADTPINITYLTNESSGHVAAAESMQQDFSEIGINMEIKTEDWNVFLTDRKNGNYDFAREGWLADFNDPINMIEMFASYSGNNDPQFGK
ncbi:MAG: ABC transporter substrate-binding protein [Erysipelotrichaceae bacterium]|nr:ABC transporter substrate-binding protein [Erysipelotrichaceae bacterium]